MKKLTYIQGAFVLTLTNLITGVLAFVYRVFLSQSIGAEGMGVYQLIMPLYSLFITLVSGGITTAVSKLAAEQHAVGNRKNMYKIIRACCVVVALWSFVLCMLIAFNADFLAQGILKDQRTLYSIIIFTPAIFFISLSAVLKGYFFGLQNVNPPAIIDVLEKLIRLVGLVATTYFLLPYGIEYVCAGAMMAMMAGEVISFIFLYAVYKRKRLPINTNDKVDAMVPIISKILLIAIPLSISGALHTIMDMINAVLIPRQLALAGYGHKAALSQYGELTGMVMPLLFFPFIIIVSLGITLVPAITSSFTGKNWTALNKKCNDALKITSVIAFASTALFLLFPRQLCDIFFKCPAAGPMLFWLAFSCAFEYWQFTLFAVLNGVGMQNKVLENSIIHIVITISCGYFLIPVPSIGIYGYIIGFNISAVVVVMRCLSMLRKIPQIKISFYDTIARPLVAFAALFVITRYSYLLLLKTAFFSLALPISCVLGLAAFIVLLFVGGTFTTKQIKSTIMIK